MRSSLITNQYRYDMSLLMVESDPDSQSDRFRVYRIVFLLTFKQILAQSVHIGERLCWDVSAQLKLSGFWSRFGSVKEFFMIRVVTAMLNGLPKSGSRFGSYAQTVPLRGALRVHILVHVYHSTGIRIFPLSGPMWAHDTHWYEVTISTFRKQTALV